MNTRLRFRIRDATIADADEACDVLRRSITELCGADHGGDVDCLAPWLANKNAEEFATWLATPDNSVLVATDSENILAVGSVRDTGEITLNYVSPHARFLGVSKSMLAALEERALNRGARNLTLKSTQTAHAFYLARGYSDLETKSGECVAMSKPASA